MPRRLLLVMLFSVLSGWPAIAEEAKVAVQMKGIGGLTCAHWRSTPATRTEGTIWILGFWTGLNYVAAASEQNQPNVNETEVMSQVEKVCAQYPSQVLASAVWKAYLDTNKN
jgi:hypothetical protein